MCYAIPGKVTEINDNIITVDYFGEKKKARNDFYALSSGDYIYAQGGFVIKVVPQKEALGVLDAWREVFFELQGLDLRLADGPRNLFQRANAVRQKCLGNSCCIHGIIEFSNHCTSDCLYCGIRKSNAKVARYRMDIDEIAQCVRYAVSELNFKALVLQSGEDHWYTEEKLVGLIKKIMREFPVLLILSVGERGKEFYRKLYEAGARGVLLRFETANPSLYEKYRPGHKLKDRIELIKELKRIGYLVFTGFLVGLPQETDEDLLNSIELTGSLSPEMFSFGPFIPHPDTPLKDAPRPTAELALSAIARARIRYPESRILATTSLETLDQENGAKLGLLSGANSLMINVTPQRYQRLYEIYPQRAGIDLRVTERIDSTLKLLRSLGRAPTDLGI